MILLHEGDEPLHKLGAPAVMLGAIIQIDHQSRDVGEALADCLPPLGESIDEAITGHFGRHTIHKEFAHGGEEEAHRRARRLRGKIVVRGMHLQAVVPAASAGANCDGRFGIYRDAQDVIRCISSLIDLVHLREDGVRFGNFFGADS